MKTVSKKDIYDEWVKSINIIANQRERIAELEKALREILEGAQGNAGACINCDSIAQRAAAALK